MRVDALKNSGFVVTKREVATTLSPEFLQRYGNLPADYLQFLQEFSLLTNRDENAWFISIDDFNDQSDSAFRWNEFEQMDLDALQDDEEACVEIRSFWDTHIPIAMAVEGEYQYLAIGLSAADYGKIYYGVEPEFEESAEVVCDGLTQLLELLSADKRDPRLASFG